MPIKTHNKPGKGTANVYKTAILLIRNPSEALRAEFYRRNGGRNGIIKDNKIKGKYRLHTNISFISYNIGKNHYSTWAFEVSFTSDICHFKLY